MTVRKLPRVVPDASQVDIDWDRARQLAAIRNAALPCVRVQEGSRHVLVKPMAMKAILKTIDDHGRGREAWLAYETIATESGCSPRTAKRAVAGLDLLSLICIRTPRSRREEPCNHYRIVWSELELLTVKKAATVTEQSATVTEQSATVTEQSATGGTRRGQKRTRTAPPTPQPLPDTSQAGQLGDWAAAECALQRTELKHVASTLRIARQLELTPVEVLRIVEEWEANRQLFLHAGSIRTRIRDGCWPVEGVQDPRVMRESREAQAALRRKREADAARAAAESAASRDEAAALEVAYGAELDAMDEVQWAELARATIRTEFEWNMFRRDRRSCRYQLLVAIHANRGQQPEGERRPVRVGKVMDFLELDASED
jgi:hypothetical protein